MSLNPGEILKAEDGTEYEVFCQLGMPHNKYNEFIIKPAKKKPRIWWISETQFSLTISENKPKVAGAVKVFKVREVLDDDQHTDDMVPYDQTR